MLAFAACAALTWQIGKGTAYSKPELISSVQSFQPGKPFFVGVRFQIKPGWHVYWRNPGDSGQEVRVSWNLPKGWSAGELMWPTPHVLTDSGLTTYVYSKEVTLLARLTPPKTAHRAKLSAHLDWLVCSDVCLPAKADLALTLKPTRKEVERQAVTTSFRKELADLTAPRLGGSAHIDGQTLVLEAQVPHSAAYKSFQFLPLSPGLVQNQPKAAATVTNNLVTLRIPKSEYFDQRLDRVRGIVKGITDPEKPDSAIFYQIDVPLVRGSGGRP